MVDRALAALRELVEKIRRLEESIEETEKKISRKEVENGK